MFRNLKPIVRNSNIVVQDFEKEVLIYDLEINKAFSLNSTSAIVFRLSDGTRTIAEISELISDKFKTPVDEEFVWLAIDNLRKENLLKNTDEIPTQFDGLSRRKIIKRIGLASLVALPAIVSLVAPLPTHAASTCINPGGIQPGQPTSFGFIRAFGNTITCENYPDSSKDIGCNVPTFNNQCCSASARYSGVCNFEIVNNGQSPSIAFFCACN